MYRKAIAYCEALSFRRVLASGLLVAVVFEAITLGVRFGFDLQSTRDTAALGAYTFGLRVHHAYIGLLLLPLGWCFPPGLRHALWIAALGLIVSDLAHHFIVLWAITGSPQFDILYPQKS